jgi:biotin transporter BioY
MDLEKAFLKGGKMSYIRFKQPKIRKKELNKKAVIKLLLIVLFLLSIIFMYGGYSVAVMLGIDTQEEVFLSETLFNVGFYLFISTLIVSIVWIVYNKMNKN